MDNGLNSVSRVQFLFSCFIDVFVAGIISASCIGVVLGGDSSQAAIEAPGPAIGPEQALRQISVGNPELILTGVVKGKVDVALISVAGARDEPFTIGDAIAPGVRLLSVESTSAVVSRDGAEERLEFSRRDSATITDSQALVSMPVLEPVSAPMSVLVQPRLFKSGLIVAFVPADTIQHLGNGRFNVKRNLINDQLRSGDFFTNARMEADTLGGFRVTDIVPGSFYDILGLKDGDTVSAINGRPPKSVADMMSLYEQKDSIKTIQLEIMRDGSPNTFQLDFQ